MLRPLRLAAPLAAALVLVPAATAATPGTYKGWLYSAGGKRLKDAPANLGVRGNRVALAAVNLRATCPYPDRRGRATRLLLSVTWAGNVRDDRVHGVAMVEGGNNELRLVGRFSGRRFTGRLSMRPAPGVAGACSSSHRVIAYRKRR